MNPAIVKKLQEQSQKLHTAGGLRRLRVSERVDTNHLRLNERELINFASNDYLALSTHPAVLKASAQATGIAASASASRLVCGHDASIEKLEKDLRDWKQNEGLLTLGSGFLANLGLLHLLADSTTAVFSDRLNHASIIDGLRLSGCKIRRYRHLDMSHLESLLRKEKLEKKIIVSDSVFSMEGDEAPLKELVRLKKKHQAMLVIDEAHATGLRGPEGQGLVYELGLQSQVDFTVGTFSKAMGSYGAYISFPPNLMPLFVSSLRPLVYSTALPPAVTAATLQSLQVLRAMGVEKRKKPLQLASAFQTRLGIKNPSPSQIVPLYCHSSDAAMSLMHYLFDEGYNAVAIRPPSVPPGRALIRFCFSSAHTESQLEKLAEILLKKEAMVFWKND